MLLRIQAIIITLAFVTRLSACSGTSLIPFVMARHPNPAVMVVLPMPSHPSPMMMMMMPMATPLLVAIIGMVSHVNHDFRRVGFGWRCTPAKDASK